MKIFLLVRLSSMGDLIHTLPAVEDLARQCPEVELHWLCGGRVWQMLPAYILCPKSSCNEMAAMAQTPLQAETWREIGRLKTDLQAESLILF